ncbi:MAG TPA: glycosyltransferase family 4 protein [Chthoniobacterales bacterium]|nr:glycosyltransferase family 4 protein [Chthoniobacterales bacterium]
MLDAVSLRGSRSYHNIDYVKLVIFAHTPPPFHGQSYMVKLMLDGLRDREHGGEPNVQFFHVDAKLSSNLEAIGQFQWSKIFLILKYCAQAYWHRFIHGADAIYYVPAPGLRAAVYRDWIVMFLCRPIFKKIILHWHASGLADWLNTKGRPWERKITEWLLSGADLSIVLSEFNRADAARFSPRAIKVVPNGIPDPCPDFDKTVLPERFQRIRERREAKRTTFTILFLGACTGAKGLFAALDATETLNRRFRARESPIDIRLFIAGEFASNEERQRFEQRVERLTNVSPETTGKLPMVEYKGFVSGEEKKRLFESADCLCFPSRYSAEAQPVTILEALAFGLPVVATRWRAIPEILADTGSRLIDDQNPAAIADALENLATDDISLKCRQVFLSRYRVDQYINNLAQAFVKLESDRTTLTD